MTCHPAMTNEVKQIEPNILEWLKGGLGWVDLRRDVNARVSSALDTVDLTSSIHALGRVLEFLARSDIDSEALARLHIALVQLREGSAPPAMLVPRSAANNLPDSVTVQFVKGGLAGVMELRTSNSANLVDAAQWVVDHVTPEALRVLAKDPRQITANTVMKWRQRFRTTQAKGIGRENYLRVVGLGRSEMAAGNSDVPLRQLRYIESYIARRLPGPAFPRGAGSGGVVPPPTG
jgi:hypothetical protein